jgi:hypothetical protein
MARKTMRRKNGGKRKTAKKGNRWNKFVMGVFNEMRRKDRNASFTDALKEASRLKKMGKY